MEVFGEEIELTGSRKSRLDIRKEVEWIEVFFFFLIFDLDFWVNNGRFSALVASVGLLLDGGMEERNPIVGVGMCQPPASLPSYWGPFAGGSFDRKL